MKENLIKIVLSVAPNAIQAIAALASIRIYSEVLKPEVLGALMLFTGIITLGEACTSAAITQTIFYYSTNPRNRRWVFDRLANTKKLRNFLAAMGALVLLWGLYKNTPLTTIIAMTFALPAYLFIESSRSAANALIQLELSKSHWAKNIVADSILTLGLTAAALTQAPTETAYALGLVASKLLASHLSIRTLIKNAENLASRDERASTTQQPEPIPSKQQVYSHLRPIAAMGVVGWASSFLDRYVVAAALGPAMTAQYSISTGIVNRPFTVVTGSLTNHFRPALFHANITHEERSQIISSWLKLAASIGIGATVAAWVFSGIITDILLATDYRATVQKLLPIVAASAAFNIATHALDNWFLAKGNNGVLLRIQIVTIPVQLVIIVTGGLAYGITGAALGRLASEILKFGTTAAQLARQMKE